MMEYERRERETEAVLNKWREHTYMERGKRELIRDVKEHVLTLLIAGGALATWVTALMLTMGMAIR